MDKDDDSKIFPQRLMEILSEEDNQDAICWLPHGRAFIVRDRNLFADKVMPKYFSRHAKYSSFTRKLNRWNFVRVSSGPELGAYYHEFFLRDKPILASQMFCKNARSKLAMSTKTPPPTETRGAEAAASLAEQQHQVQSQTTTLLPSSLQSSTGDEDQKPMAAANTSVPRVVVPPVRALAPPANPTISLPPDIPLGLLELLTKGPSGSNFDAAPGVRVPGRLLQQSQYANLLVERQIQILQAEQAKLMLIRNAAFQQQQREQQLILQRTKQEQANDEETLRRLMDLKLRQKQNRGPVNHRASAA